jgi:hypothetical protein
MTTYHMEGLGPSRRVQRRGREGPFALDVQLGAVADVTPEGCWMRAMTDVVLERLPADVETLWRLGFVELLAIMKEVVRRPQGFVSTKLDDWYMPLWRRGSGRDWEDAAALVAGRPGGRIVLVDIGVTAGIADVQPGDWWRVGRVSTVSTLLRVCGALVELGIPVSMDVGAFVWLQAEHPEDWLKMNLAVREVLAP